MNEPAATPATVQVHLPKSTVGWLVELTRKIVETGLKDDISALKNTERGRARIVAVLLPLVHAAGRRLATRQDYDQLHTQGAIVGLTDLSFRELLGGEFLDEHAAELSERGPLIARFRQWYGGQPALVITIEKLLERYEFHRDYPVDQRRLQQLGGALAGLATAFADGDRLAQLAGLSTGEGVTAH